MRGTAWAAGTAAAAVVLAAGCGTVRYHGPAEHGHGRTTAAVTPGPPTTTRQQAERLAQELLSRAPLPAGARRTTRPPVKALARSVASQPGSPSVALHGLWTVTARMDAVNTFLKSHVPTGMAVSGSGQTGQLAGVPERIKRPAKPPGGGVQPGNVGTITEEFVTYQPSRLPAGVSAATLNLAVAPAGTGRSEVRVDVQVIWFPPRSAAEYVPAGMRAVTVTASQYGPKQDVSTRTFTSPATVRRLAALLNGVHASPGIFANCPMIWVSYRLAFAASPHAAPALVVTDGGCGSLQVTALGHVQPALQVPARLNSVLAGLMHVRMVPGTGVITPASGPAAGTPAPACTKPSRGIWSGMPPGSMRETRDSGTMPKSPCLPAAPAAP